MRRIPILAFVALLIVPAVAGAQQWTPEQQQLWGLEVSCWQNRTVAGFEACFHEDFVGWGINSTVTTTKADRKPGFVRSYATEEQVFLNLKPVNITVKGDMAVVQYIATYTMKDKATGQETTTVERWTDIWYRDGGTWAWIADHGMELKDDGK